MRKTLRLTAPLAVFLLIQAAVAAQVRWSGKSFDDALAEASQAKGYVMVDFFTAWCSPCKVLDATAWKDPGLSKLLGDRHVVALRLDAEKEGKALASRYSVRGYPTVILVNPKGQEVTRFLGARETSAIARQFEAAFKDPRTLEELRQVAKEKPEDLQVKYDLAQKLLTSVNPLDQTEGESLLSLITARDPENERGVGAKALVNLLTRRMRLICNAQARAVRDRFALPLIPDHVYPGLHEEGPDEELMRLHDETAKALEAYYGRLETTAGEDLVAAAAVLSKMKDTDVDASEFAELESFVAGDSMVPANRKLCEGYYLVLGQIAKNATSLNNAAWYFYTAQSHLDLAETWARRAVALDPQGINAQDTLAHVLFSTGRGPEAFELERKLLADAKTAGDDSSARIFEGVLASWEKGLADQTLPPGGAGRE